MGAQSADRAAKVARDACRGSKRPGGRRRTSEAALETPQRSAPSALAAEEAVGDPGHLPRLRGGRQPAHRLLAQSL